MFSADMTIAGFDDDLQVALDHERRRQEELFYAAEMAEALKADTPSPMTYASPKPDEVLAEDEIISTYPLGIASVRIVPVTRPPSARVVGRYGSRLSGSTRPAVDIPGCARSGQPRNRASSTYFSMYGLACSCCERTQRRAG